MVPCAYSHARRLQSCKSTITVVIHTCPCTPMHSPKHPAHRATQNAHAHAKRTLARERASPTHALSHSPGPSAARQAQLLESGFMERAVACLGSSLEPTQDSALSLLAALTAHNRRACRRLLLAPGAVQAVARRCVRKGSSAPFQAGTRVELWGAKQGCIRTSLMPANGLAHWDAPGSSERRSHRCLASPAASTTHLLRRLSAWMLALHCASNIAVHGGAAGAAAIAARRDVIVFACSLLVADGCVASAVPAADLLIAAAGGAGSDGSGPDSDSDGSDGDDSGSESDAGRGSDGRKGPTRGGSSGRCNGKQEGGPLQLGSLTDSCQADLTTGVGFAVVRWLRRMSGDPSAEARAAAPRVLRRALRLLRQGLEPGGVSWRWPVMPESLADVDGFLPALARLAVAKDCPPGPPGKVRRAEAAARRDLPLAGPRRPRGAGRAGRAARGGRRLGAGPGRLGRGA